MKQKPQSVERPYCERCHEYLDAPLNADEMLWLIHAFGCRQVVIRKEVTT